MEKVAPGTLDSAATKARLRRRYAAERRFRLYGVVSVCVALGFLATLLVTIVGNGFSAFRQAEIRLDVFIDPAVVDPERTGDPKVLAAANYATLIRNALVERFPEAGSRGDRRQLGGLMSSGAEYELQQAVIADTSLIGTRQRFWLPMDDDVDTAMKSAVPETAANEGSGRLNAKQMGWLKQLRETGEVGLKFNSRFFTSGDSREPELAGIWGAAVGSLWTMLVTLGLSFPIGIATAVYLEEFAPRNRFTDLIEVNINNLAAVPSIVFGLLGLAVFLNFFNMPRSAPLVGGLVLMLITLPTIIIAARAALKAVPPSIREAALGLGASPLQMVAHHVIPLAMPGMLTGTIIGMAHALGETAPLLMIGMVAFVVDIPGGLTDPATVLPVQIYLWADSPERAFVERTSAAIIVLLAFLAVMNLAAVLLRKKFEKKW